MTELRILNVVVWAWVLVYMLPAVWSATYGAVRRGDPMRMGCATTAIVMIGFNLRWLLLPESALAWIALYVLSAADAVFILLLARMYGRGEHV